ncbi:hypothetical protein CABS01_15916 [Colletotrichum abscissum]|uniref:uncharacterized protein n=1 Tax=Colletotrichum abscissum TaxID=1671311 RepID=UPI0027D67661|nr:uncharacterized protein CABS01_15916 [Colletotrichum abscissum]KAK1474326.1 hypothetical protein CABS01_15916 [Colletotrichum abscissum]
MRLPVCNQSAPIRQYVDAGGDEDVVCPGQIRTHGIIESVACCMRAPYPFPTTTTVLLLFRFRRSSSNP